MPNPDIHPCRTTPIAAHTQHNAHHLQVAAPHAHVVHGCQAWCMQHTLMYPMLTIDCMPDDACHTIPRTDGHRTTHCTQLMFVVLHHILWTCSTTTPTWCDMMWHRSLNHNRSHTILVCECMTAYWRGGGRLGDMLGDSCHPGNVEK